MQRWMLIGLLALLPALAQGQVIWDRQNIDGNGQGYQGGYPQIAAADLDNDGDLDLAAYAVYAGHAAVMWNVDGAGQEWETTVLGQSFMPVGVGDLDGDGDDDLITAVYSGYVVSWWQNNGDGNLVASPLAGSLPHVGFVCTEDIDSDGDLDVLVAHDNGDAVSWLENLQGDASEWTAHPVTSDLDHGYRLSSGDINGDGYPDIVTLSHAVVNNGINWYQNMDGSGTSWALRPVTTDWPEAKDVVVEDMDLDGDLDVVASYNVVDGLAWYENVNGHGDNWTTHLLPYEGQDPWSGLPMHLDVADVDGDDDPDVVTALLVKNKHVWLENVDGQAGAWQRHLLAGEVLDPEAIVARDINGDGAVDLATAPHDDGYVTVWYQPVDRALTLTPTSNLDLPPEGGTVTYTVEVLNQTGTTYPAVTFWTDVVTPPWGQVVGPTFSYGFTLQAGMDFTYDGLSQPVPPFAPAGTYVFRAYLGYPGVGWMADTFAFTKQAGDDDVPPTREDAAHRAWRATATTR